MRCIHCQSENMRCQNSRKKDYRGYTATFRRLKCQDCGNLQTTWELGEDDILLLMEAGDFAMSQMQELLDHLRNTS